MKVTGWSLNCFLLYFQADDISEVPDAAESPVDTDPAEQTEVRPKTHTLPVL